MIITAAHVEYFTRQFYLPTIYGRHEKRWVEQRLLIYIVTLNFIAYCNKKTRTTNKSWTRKYAKWNFENVSSV